MGLSRNQNFVIGALVVSAIGLLFHLIGFASPYWYKQETSASKANGGLWKQCVEITGTGERCTDISGSHAKAYQEATQALGMIGLFCCIGGVVVIILKQFVMKEHAAMNHGYLIAIGLLAAAALFILMEIAVWAGEVGSNIKDHLSWAIWLDVVGLIFIVIGAVLIGIPSS